MQFVPHPKQTRSLGAPLGWDHSKVHCGSLSICDTQVGGYAKMESVWEPEGFEAARLALGEASIRLGVIGTVHPPVSMHVQIKDIDRKQQRENLSKLLHDLLEYANAEGFSVEASAQVGSGDRSVVIGDHEG